MSGAALARGSGGTSGGGGGVAADGQASGGAPAMSSSNLTSTARGRRRRNQASRAQRQASHQQQQQQNAYANGHAAAGRFAPPHQHGVNGPGQFAGPNSNVRGGGNHSMPPPPPGMHPHVPPLTGMGWGTREDDEPADFILDDLDKLTSRDVAVARYKRNHELLSVIFDARRIDSLTPSPSPYASQDQGALRAELQRCKEETERLQSEHLVKVKRWQDEQKEYDQLLHAPLKRVRLQQVEQEQQRQAGTDEGERDANGQLVPAWASKAGQGAVVGMGFVRAETPEEVRKLLPKPPEPEPEPTPTPTPTPPVPQPPSIHVPGATSTVAAEPSLPTAQASAGPSAVPVNTNGAQAGTGQAQEMHAADAQSSVATVKNENGQGQAIVPADQSAMDLDASTARAAAVHKPKAELADGEDEDADADEDEDADSDEDADADADVDVDVEDDGNGEGLAAINATATGTAQIESADGQKSSVAAVPLPVTEQSTEVTEQHTPLATSADVSMNDAVPDETFETAGDLTSAADQAPSDSIVDGLSAAPVAAAEPTEKSTEPSGTTLPDVNDTAVAAGGNATSIEQDIPQAPDMQAEQEDQGANEVAVVPTADVAALASPVQTLPAVPVESETFDTTQHHALTDSNVLPAKDDTARVAVNLAQAEASEAVQPIAAESVAPTSAESAVPLPEGQDEAKGASQDAL